MIDKRKIDDTLTYDEIKQQQQQNKIVPCRRYVQSDDQYMVAIKSKFEKRLNETWNVMKRETWWNVKMKRETWWNVKLMKRETDVLLLIETE